MARLVPPFSMRGNMANNTLAKIPLPSIWSQTSICAWTKELMSTEIGTRYTLPAILYRLRLIGNVSALIFISAVFYELKLGPIFFIGLAVYCLGYPPLAYWYASRAPKPRPAEFQTFCASAAAWGFWIAAMQFNLVPSLLVATGMHTEGAGGWKLYWKGLFFLACGIGAGVLVCGFNFQPTSSLFVLLWSTPGLVIFPLMLGITNYNLSRRLVRQHRRALQQSRTDGLSGLMNREYFDHCAEMEFHRCQRGGHLSCFVMIDIDYFKQANDRHGHLAGDKVIKDIAEVFAEEVREIDLVARYGGEEFCICLVDTHACAAAKVAERIRTRVEATIKINDQACTISCGVAEYNAKYSNYHQWLNKADKALYRAKQLGRNRVEVADPPAILSTVQEQPT